MRFTLPTLLIAGLSFFGCSEKDEPNFSIVQTLEVANSSSSTRMFRGVLEHVGQNDTILSYGFEWENRYGTWKTKKPGHLSKGSFFIRDYTPLSKWSTFTVRAFVETPNGIIYGDAETFATASK